MRRRVFVWSIIKKLNELISNLDRRSLIFMQKLKIFLALTCFWTLRSLFVVRSLFCRPFINNSLRYFVYRFIASIFDSLLWFRTFCFLNPWRWKNVKKSLRQKQIFFKSHAILIVRAFWPPAVTLCLCVSRRSMFSLIGNLNHLIKEEHLKTASTIKLKWIMSLTFQFCFRCF